jgi:hypothetical protein
MGICATLYGIKIQHVRYLEKEDRRVASDLKFIVDD